MGGDRDFKFVTHIASLNLQMTNSPKKGVVIVMWPIVNFCKLYHIFKFHMGGLDPHGSLAPHESTSRTTLAVFARLEVMTDRPKGKGICRVLIMNYSSLGAQDHTDLPVTHTFVYKWNETSTLSHRASPHFWLVFISRPSEGRRLSWPIVPWWNTSVVCPTEDGHPSKYYLRQPGIKLISRIASPTP